MKDPVKAWQKQYLQAKKKDRVAARNLLNTRIMELALKPGGYFEKLNFESAPVFRTIWGTHENICMLLSQLNVTVEMCTKDHEDPSDSQTLVMLTSYIGPENRDVGFCLSELFRDCKLLTDKMKYKVNIKGKPIKYFDVMDCGFYKTI